MKKNIKNHKIIDTINYNGRYRNVVDVRARILSISTALFVLACFVVLVFLF